MDFNILNENNEFKLGNIISIFKLSGIDREFALFAIEDFDIDDYINTTFRMFNAEHTDVVLLCNNDVIDSIIDRFGEDVVITEDENEKFKITVNVATSHIFYNWIFGFGGKVKILRPENIRSEYEEMLKNALKYL